MKKIIFIIFAALIVAANIPHIPASVRAADPLEITNARTKNAKYYDLGDGRRAISASVGPIHYDDGQGWQDIDTRIINGSMTAAPYNFDLLQNQFNAGQVVKFSVGSHSVALQPMALEWTNNLNQLSQISMPQAVAGQVDNNDAELSGRVDWLEGYGQGLDFAWLLDKTRVTKIITVRDFGDLTGGQPEPPAYILSGGNATLRFNMLFAPSSELDIFIDGQEWAGGRPTTQTFGRIEFRDNATGATAWDFAPMYYWDSNGNGGQSIKTVRRAGQDLFIEVRVPYSWLKTAVYPVFIDTVLDVDVDNNDNDALVRNNNQFFDDWTQIIVGRSGSSVKRYGMSIRWTGINIADGMTVTTAYTTMDGFTTDAGGDDIAADIHFEDNNNPAVITTLADYNGRDRTTAGYSNYSIGAITADAPWQSPSLVTALQEVIDDNAGTGDAITLFIEDLDDDSVSDGSYRSFASLEHSTFEPPNIYIEYSAGGPAAPTVTTNAAQSVEETTATLSGNVTGSDNATQYHFNWDTDTGAPYASNWSSGVGDYTGEFTHGITGLTPGETIYYYASANNSGGTGNGTEVTFLTKPNPATGAGTTASGPAWIASSWTNGTGTDYQEIRYSEGSAPSDNTSGTLGYWGAGTSANVTGLSEDTTYHFRAFTHANQGALWSISDGSVTWNGTTGNTDPPDTPTGVSATDGSSTDNVTITWNAAAGATDYQVFRDGSGLGWLGDVTAHIDTGADAPTITAGTVTAADNVSSAFVTLANAGESANAGTTHSYYVRAKNGYGESGNSTANTGYVGVGALGYQWERSAADSDAAYSTIGGATTDPYNDTGGVADPDGRYYRVVLSAAGASPVTTAADRGYMSVEGDDNPTPVILNFLRTGGDTGDLYFTSGADTAYSIIYGRQAGEVAWWTAANTTSNTTELSGLLLDILDYDFTVYNHTATTASNQSNIWTTEGAGTMDITIEWGPVLLIALSLGLLMINVFRFNILLVIAAVFINVALAQQPGLPLYVLIGAWFLALAELTAGIAKLVWGNSKERKRRRFVG